VQVLSRLKQEAAIANVKQAISGSISLALLRKAKSVYRPQCGTQTDEAKELTSQKEVTLS
jgi:hypothetical protein